MTTDQNGRGASPSDDPRDYSLPVTVSVDRPDTLPDGVSADDIPETETISPYTGDPEEHDLDLVATALEHDYSEPVYRALAVFAHHDERGLHAQELTARADVAEDTISDIIATLLDADLIRRSRVAGDIPFYQLNTFNETARRIRNTI